MGRYFLPSKASHLAGYRPGGIEESSCKHAVHLRHSARNCQVGKQLGWMEGFWWNHSQLALFEATSHLMPVHSKLAATHHASGALTWTGNATEELGSGCRCFIENASLLAAWLTMQCGLVDTCLCGFSCFFFNQRLNSRCRKTFRAKTTTSRLLSRNSRLYLQSFWRRLCSHRKRVPKSWSRWVIL